MVNHPFALLTEGHEEHEKGRKEWFFLRVFVPL
jgi:hypothetical protein